LFEFSQLETPLNDALATAVRRSIDVAGNIVIIIAQRRP
jgi:hypothetical protein